jgi:peptide/nickel transport system permease protein
MIIFGLAVYPTFARLVRGEVLQLRERDFTTAAHAVGASARRVILRHLLPNLVGPVLALAVLEMATVILYESGLGFLGLSVPPRIPTWGGMLADGRQYLTSAWWMAVFPGLAIMVTVPGLNLAGEWLRAKLAPDIRA